MVRNLLGNSSHSGLQAVVAAERPLGWGTEEPAQCWVGSRMAWWGDVSSYIQTPEATEWGWPEAQQLQSHKGQSGGPGGGGPAPTPPPSIIPDKTELDVT